jgi:uncharacterized protein YceH (UPF0502 family)
METSILEMAKKTAESMNFLIIKLAERVEELEKENADLKQKLSAHDDDLK